MLVRAPVQLDRMASLTGFVACAPTGPAKLRQAARANAIRMRVLDYGRMTVLRTQNRVRRPLAAKCCDRVIAEGRIIAVSAAGRGTRRAPRGRPRAPAR